MTSTRSLIDTLKRRACDMAKPFIEAARQPNATEIERALCEAAQVILRDAEARAQRLPREEFEERVHAFKEWHRRHEAEMRRATSSLSEHGFRRREQKRRMSDTKRRATAELDHREAEFHEWVESHALAAWIRATEDLLTLDRPSAFISSQASPARH
jgi:hypothetical protein